MSELKKACVVLPQSKRRYGEEKKWRTAHSCGMSWTGWQRWPRKAESDEYHRPVKWNKREGILMTRHRKHYTKVKKKKKKSTQLHKI